MQTFYQALLENRTVGAEEMLASYQQHWLSETLPVQFGKSESEEILFETAGRMPAYRKGTCVLAGHVPGALLPESRLDVCGMRVRGTVQAVAKFSGKYKKQPARCLFAHSHGRNGVELDPESLDDLENGVKAWYPLSG